MVYPIPGDFPIRRFGTWPVSRSDGGVAVTRGNAADDVAGVVGWRPRSGLPVPFGARAEYGFRLAASVASGNRAGRCWLVAAALGAGLRGTELAGVTAGQVVDLDGGRLL